MLRAMYGSAECFMGLFGTYAQNQRRLQMEASEWRGSLLLPSCMPLVLNFFQWSFALTPRDLAPFQLHFK
jgi:hypothetical protein